MKIIEFDPGGEVDRITNAPSIHAWNERIDRICQDDNAHPYIRDRYRDPHWQGHYQAVATKLWRDYGDWDLTLAGYLHGIPSEVVENPAWGPVPPRTIAILRAREKFKSLNIDDPDVTQQLKTHVLPSIGNAGAVALFLNEKRHHLDPEERLSRWTRHFHTRPAPPPELPDAPLFAYSPFEREQWFAFYRKVVVPTVRFFGFWEERNVIDDALLYYAERPRFDRLLAITLEVADGQQAVISDLIACLETIIAETRPISLHWEWHTLGKIARRVNGESWPDTPGLLQRMGYVVIRFPEAADCYGALFRLHRDFRHIPGKLSDYIGMPPSDRYQAIHTQIANGRHTLPGATALNIRLMPESTFEMRRRRDQPAQPLALEQIRRQFYSPVSEANSRVNRNRTITVFAFDGRPYPLSHGATVLEFAYRVRKQFIGHLQGASVNTRRCGLLHPLDHGDIVHLDIQPTPCFLPNRVLRHLQREAANGPGGEVTARYQRILRRYRKVMRPALEQVGRRHLIERLRGEGVTPGFLHRFLDSFLNDAAQHLQQEPASRLTARPGDERPLSRRWLEQIGILSLERNDTNPGYRVTITPDQIDRLVDEILRIIVAENIRDVYELSFPDDLRRSHLPVRQCDQCHPNLRGAVSATIADDAILLHQADSRCGKEGVPVSTRRKRPPASVFVVEARQHPGLLEGVLGVFTDMHLEVVDCVARNNARGRQVIRVQLRYLDDVTITAITAALNRLPGIIRAVGPHDDPLPELEGHLPPRIDNGLELHHNPPPYFSGDGIQRDFYFYGMGSELRWLQMIYGDATQAGSAGGRGAFITGPKRGGKTSLVFKFGRELATRLHTPVLWYYFQCPRYQGWGEFRSHMRQIVRDVAARQADSEQVRLALPTDLPLPELVRLTIEQLDSPAVMVIDEGVGLMKQCQEDGNEAEFLRCLEALLAIPRLMLIVVGPEAQANALSADNAQFLNRCTRVEVQRLTREESTLLIRAGKMHPIYDITVDAEVTAALYRLTAGYPYWLTRLGEAMWQIGRRRDTASTSYTPQVLQRAVDNLTDSRVEFADRLSVTGPLDRLILKLLSEMVDPDDYQARPLSVTELRDRLAHFDVTVPEADLDERLRRLRWMGSVRRLNRREDAAWVISAPLLGLHIRVRSDF